MTLIVKIMSGENLPDDDTRKSYTLHTGVASVEFHRRPGAPVAAMCFGDAIVPLEFPLEGNVYVMNEAGRTVSSFGVSPPPAVAELHRADCALVVDGPGATCDCGGG